MPKFNPTADKRGIPVSKYLSSKLVVFLSSDKREDAVKALVDRLNQEGYLNDYNEFIHAVEEREKIVTTGIGLGVAIPHAKLHDYDDFFIAIGILDKGIDWGALDGALVRLIFMIGGPDDKQTEYLKLLSSLTVAIKDEERRKKLLKAATAEEVMKLFEGC